MYVCVRVCQFMFVYIILFIFTNFKHCIAHLSVFINVSPFLPTSLSRFDSSVCLSIFRLIKQIHERVKDVKKETQTKVLPDII